MASYVSEEQMRKKLPIVIKKVLSPQPLHGRNRVAQSIDKGCYVRIRKT